MSRAALAARLLPWIVLAACRASAPVERPSPRPAVQPAPRPALEVRTTLYTADEALKDILSGPLEHIGTGRWPGVDRSFSCAFRNQRVVVVNAYCTRKEAPAFRIDVYSPGRGRVRVYAESNGPISERDRASYFSFTAATEPPPGPSAPIGTIGLAMSFDELKRYEKKRYDAYLPACVAGEQNERPIETCLGPLASEIRPYVTSHRDFLAHGSRDYYQVVRLMRELAARYGKDPR